MALFLPRTYTTLVTRKQNQVIIEQFNNDEFEQILSRVTLSVEQFEDICERYKELCLEEDGGDE